MRRLLLLLVSCLGLTVPAAVAAPTALAAPPTEAAAAPDSGNALTDVCDPGWVCVYEGDVWDGGTNHPLVYSWYSYGIYNVHGLVGEYTVFNCQTDGAGVRGYTGWDGTGSVAWNLDINNCSAGYWRNLTSTYSVQLYP
ncbi:hypothetical protein [Streptomyces sp. TR06-5]|uniref:hypothetical protein n=1 Tax=unclassified Streptomyces TaxID=2593676 RepID=UPI0039A0E112